MFVLRCTKKLLGRVAGQITPEREPDQSTTQMGDWTANLLIIRRQQLVLAVNNLTLLGVFVGIAETAHELAVAAATSQTKLKFGGALSAAPGVQTRMGELTIALFAATSALSTAGARLDAFIARHAGRLPTMEDAHACMAEYQCAKWIVHENTIAAVSAAMDIVGGSAFMSGHPLSRLYRDVRAGPFMQPFSPIEAREYVGQVMLGLWPEG